MAYPQVAKEGTWSALLAGRGITGPTEVFEGNKGFKESIAGDFELDWSAEDLEMVRKSIIKKHNAEIHSQSALDAALDVRGQHGFDVSQIRDIQLKTFDVAYSIIGGGEEGDKRNIQTKEEADHSLPWMLAAILLDGELTPEQYEPHRIVASDVQTLMQKVSIIPDAAFSDRFPDAMPAELTVTLENGTILKATRDSYEGFHDNPLTWDGARKKFDRLATPYANDELRDQIAEIVRNLEEHKVAELTGLLQHVGAER